eukprot:symbB.v1.2.008107.t1/scaffold456.1/size203390/10
MAEQVLPDNQLGDSQVMLAAQPSPQETQHYPETLADVEDKGEEKGLQVAVAATPTPQRARSPPDQETKKQKPVETMSWDDLQYMSNGHQYCQHCQMPVDVTTKTAVRKKTHKQVSCKQSDRGMQRKQKDDEKDEEQSEENLDEKDWCSVDSSDDEKKKIIHVHETKGGKGGNQKRPKTLTLSEEEKKALKEQNQGVIKIVKKALKELEPLSKAASKTMNSANSDEQFKKEVWALKQVVKEAKKVERQHKDSKQTSLSFDHNEETIAALKDQIQKKQKAMENVDAMLQGGFDAAHLELLASAAKRRKDAVDVS